MEFNWFVNQLDYIYLWYGISFLLLSVICFRLVYLQPAGRISWKWLGLFAALHGLNEWLDMFAMAVTSNWLDLLRPAMLTLSFTALIGFCASALKDQTAKGLGRFFFIVPLLLCSVASFWGVEVFKAVVRYTMAFPGALLASWILFSETRHTVAKRRYGLVAAAVAFLVYAVAGGLIVAAAPIWPAATINSNSWLTWSGFPVEFIRALCALVCLSGIWFYGRFLPNVRETDLFFKRFLFPVLMPFLFATGWSVVDWHGGMADVNLREDILRIGISIGQTINPDRARALTFTAADSDNPAFLRLRSQMLALGNFQKGLRGIYTVAIRDGQMFFGPENYADGDSQASPVGTRYEQPDPRLWQCFADGKPIAIGPFADEYGTFISAFVPVRDPATGKTIMLVGIDVLAEDWKQSIIEARFAAILPFLALVILSIAAFCVLQWRDLLKASAQNILLMHTETIFVFIFGLTLTFIVAFFLNETELIEKRRSFRWVADVKNQLIGESFRQIRRDLDGFARFMGSNSFFKPFKEFKSYVEPMQRLKQTLCWHWIAFVEHADKESFEQRIRSEGFTDFSISVTDDNGQSRASAEKSCYYPVVYKYPLNSDILLKGHDLGSNELEKTAIGIALKSGLVTAAFPLTQFHENSEDDAMLLLQPVFAASTKVLLGFAGLTLRVQSLLDSIVPVNSAGSEGVVVEIAALDGVSEPKFIAAFVGGDKRGRRESYAEHPFCVSYPLLIFGRSFLLKIYPNNAYNDNSIAYNGFAGAGWAGFLITSIITLFVGFLRNRQFSLEELVAVRAREVIERENDLFITLNSIGDAVIATDTNARITRMNPAAVKLTGWSFSDAHAAHIAEVFKIINYRSRSSVPCPVLTVLETGKIIELANDTTLIAKDKKEYQIADSAAPIRDIDGQIRGVVLVFHDVTAQYYIKEELRKSEEQLKTLLANLPGISYRCLNDQCWTVKFVSTEIERLTGFAVSDFIDSPTLNFAYIIHPDDISLVADAVAKSVSERVSFEVEYRMRRKNGDYLWVFDRGQGVFDASGNLKWLEGVILDVTQKKLVEEALLESEQSIRAITDSAHDAILMVDGDTRISYWNPGAEKIFGYSKSEAIGNNLQRLIAPARYITQFETIFSQFKQSGHDLSVGKAIDLEARCKDGREISVSFSLSAIQIKGKWHAVSIIRDVTDKKLAEDKLRRTLTELEEANLELQRLTLQAEELASEARMANAAKSEFLANMSHEIRTPMNGIIGMTSLLLDTELNAEQRQYSEVVRSSSENLLMLINDILDFSKIEAGKMTLDEISFDLRTAIEDAVEVLAVKAHEKGLELACIIAPEVPSLLSGDPGRLRQIVINLAGNAVKFTEKGEVVIAVNLEHESDSEVLLNFSVKDTGIGIPSDRIDALFSAFTQLDGSTTRKYGGTGLGLAISKQLVSMMGGKIGATSVPGVGSQFWFTAHFSKQADGVLTDALPMVNIAGTKILVVDDHAVNRLLVTNLLASWGCRYAEASDGSSALDMLETAFNQGEPYQVALLDMLMPEMDGRELCTRIKKNPDLRNTKLVLLTSLGQRGDAAWIQNVGFSGYLTKPLRQSQLHDCLAMVIGISSDSEDQTPLITRHQVAEAIRRNIRILLVEDNLTNQEVAMAILKKLGYGVDLAKNGVEALAELQQNHYHLVLLDCQMPEMDGFETVEAIRSGRFPVLNPQIPVIAMTANAMAGDKDRCIESGMDDYIAKPVQPRELVEKISLWLSRTKGSRSGSNHSLVSETHFSDHEGGMEIFVETELFQRLLCDAELVKRIIKAFYSDTPQHLAELKVAIASGNFVEARRLAHNIKGSAANISALALHRAALELETLIKEDKAAMLEDSFALLVKQFEMLTSLLRERGYF